MSSLFANESILVEVTANDPPIYLAYSDEDTWVPPASGQWIQLAYWQVGRQDVVSYDDIDNTPHTAEWDLVDITMLNQFLDDVRNGVLF